MRAPMMGATQNSHSCSIAQPPTVETLLPLLAALLPMIIDQLTPDGQVPQGGPADNQADIGDLLGGILGGGLGGILGGGG